MAKKNDFDCPACSTRIPWRRRWSFTGLFRPRVASCPQCGVKLMRNRTVGGLFCFVVSYIILITVREWTSVFPENFSYVYITVLIANFAFWINFSYFRGELVWKNPLVLAPPRSRELAPEPRG